MRPNNAFCPALFSSQVKLLSTNNAFCTVQRAIAQTKDYFFHCYGAADAPHVFQAGSPGFQAG
jgi:hypothetical protein